MGGELAWISSLKKMCDANLWHPLLLFYLLSFIGIVVCKSVTWGVFLVATWPIVVGGSLRNRKGCDVHFGRDVGVSVDACGFFAIAICKFLHTKPITLHTRRRCILNILLIRRLHFKPCVIAAAKYGAFVIVLFMATLRWV